MVEASIWKTDSITYRLQIQFKNQKEMGEVSSFLKDWNLVATGFNKKGHILNIFSKQFEDPKSWLSFAKTLPLALVECDKNGNKKPVKTALKKKKTTTIKVAKQTGRRCGKCGKTGHNARTCK